MPLSVIHARSAIGIKAPLITIEVHISAGLPAFNVVGLPHRSISEAKERVRSAILNSGLTFPPKRITINLSPADLPKQGARFDLAIAVGVLAASGQIPINQLHHYEFMGELALSGELRPVAGAFIAALSLPRTKSLITCSEHQDELSVIPHLKSFYAAHLQNIITFFNDHAHAGSTIISNPAKPTPRHFHSDNTEADFRDVLGQPDAINACLYAAAGGHNLLLYGAPGSGKTMLAERIASIMPPLTQTQAIENAAIHSVAGLDVASLWGRRPFRQPHHSSSIPALTGGGVKFCPGEMTLANHGVLFLDELAEFSAHALDHLRQPLEANTIAVARAQYHLILPAHFQLIAAMNPSPTGDIYNNRSTYDQTVRYLQRVSGPLLDRIDIQIEVKKVPISELSTLSQTSPSTQSRTSSATLKATVADTQARQISRQGCLNDALDASQIKEFCQLDELSSEFFNRAIEELELSARVYQRVLKVARTIADCHSAENIDFEHLRDALKLRAFDRFVHHYTQYEKIV